MKSISYFFRTRAGLTGFVFFCQCKGSFTAEVNWISVWTVEVNKSGINVTCVIYLKNVTDI